MKIATYNVWYPNIEKREAQLLREIRGLDADIIGLQEVPPEFYKKLAESSEYVYHAYARYDAPDLDDEEMGLALLSKYPFCEQTSPRESGADAFNVIFEVEDIRYSVTNVHLPWDSALEKEKQIVAIDEYIHNQKEKVDFFILLGDFNCTESSSIHHFLLGDQSLLGSEAKPYWNDLAGAHAALNGYRVKPTLDFVNNPRWRGENTNYVPYTCDRIYIMESFNWDNEFKLRDIEVFGKEVSVETGLASSDHYGVCAAVDFYK